MDRRLLPVGVHQNIHVGRLHGRSAIAAAELSLVVRGQKGGGAIEIQAWLNQSAPNRMQLEPLLGRNSVVRQIFPEGVFHTYAERDTAIRSALLGVVEERVRDA